MPRTSRYPELSLIQQGCRIYPGQTMMWWAARLALHPRELSALEYVRWLNKLVNRGILVAFIPPHTMKNRRGLYTPDSPEYWKALASPRSS